MNPFCITDYFIISKQQKSDTNILQDFIRILSQRLASQSVCLQQQKWNIFGWNTPNRYVFFPFRIRLFSLWQWHITNSHYINETRSVTTRWDHLRNFFRLFWCFSYYYFFYDSICIANPRFLWLVYAAEQNTHAHAHRKRNAISHAF